MLTPRSQPGWLASSAAATCGFMLLALGGSPAAAASSPSAPSPAREPDFSVRALASHQPGVPSGPVSLPVRKGPWMRGPSGQGPSAPAPASNPLTAVVTGVDQRGLPANGATPSDSTGAIGPNHYIEMVNSEVGIFDRSLSSVASPVPVGTFVGASSGAAVGDVQVEWDQQAGRWLYLSLETYTNFSNNFIALGWSKGGDSSSLTLANADWCNFHISTGTELDDYPKLGHDPNYIVIGANAFANAGSTNPSFSTAVIRAIPKPAPTDTTCAAPAVFGFGTSANPIRHLAPDSQPAFTPVPANAADSAGTGYIVALDPGPSASAVSYIGVWHVNPPLAGTSCPSTPCLVADGEIATGLWAPPPAADWMIPQPNTSLTIDALDGRPTQAVQMTDPQAGTSAVWTQHTTQDASGRTIVTWYELIPAACAGGVCGIGARRQEGVLSDPNLWLFNAAISPTSTGDATMIHYNSGSGAAFVEARAQSRNIADPRNVMSGETVLGSSTVADSDFSCYSGGGGPPCRWGDYAGASPDPVSCSTVWGTTMLSGDTSALGGTPTWVTQNFAVTEGSLRSAVSTQQYTLTASDGQTWQDMDSSRLRLGVAPCSDSTALISANVDLFTSKAGVNQDIGVFVDVDGVPGTTPVAWKESGGFAGTFSPNAAYAQATFDMPAGHTYNVRLKWKANKATPGTIYAGAGPLPPTGYSPTRLALRLFTPAQLPTLSVTQTQPKSTGSDGQTWVPIPGVAPLSLPAPADSQVVLGGNADLWTDTAGYNQDIGIRLSGGSFGAGQVVAWKESGGFAGTFSPNAAFVQATATLSAGQTYFAELVWKTNLPAPASASIYAGAGPLPPSSAVFSPTSLTARLVPAGTNPSPSVSTAQPTLSNSDGIHWTDMGPSILVTSAQTTASVVSANADLWTSSAGFNQDLGISVSVDGGPQRVLVWKESGGFGGTFSPNAAFAEADFTISGGHSYLFKLVWKTNRSEIGTGAKIYAGAGPIGSEFSPTSLLIEFVN